MWVCMNMCDGSKIDRYRGADAANILKDLQFIFMPIITDPAAHSNSCCVSKKITNTKWSKNRVVIDIFANDQAVIF